MKESIDKLLFIKMKSSFSVKDTMNRIQTQTTDWEKIFVKDVSDEKRLLPKTHKELLKFNNKRTNNLI